MKRPKTINGIIRFWELFKENNEDYDAMAAIYNCSSGTIRNWTNKLENYKSVVCNTDKKKSYKDMSLDELCDVYSDSIDIMEKPIDSFDIELPKSCVLVCMSDAHLGSTYTRVKEWNNDVNLISENNSVFALFNGDLLDYSEKGPKDLINDQVYATNAIAKDLAKKSIQKMGNSILAMVSGCHDNWDNDPYILSLGEYTLTNAVSRDLMVINLKVGDNLYRILMRHKMKYGSMYSRAATLFANFMKKIEFDIGFDAHKHNPAIGTEYIKGRKIIAVSGGSYKSLDSYARDNGYYKIPFSIPGLYLDCERWRAIPFLDWHDALTMLSDENAA